MQLDPDNFPLATDYAEGYYGIRPLRTNDALVAWTNTLHIAHDDIEREGVYIHLARIKMLAGRYAEARAAARRGDQYDVFRPQRHPGTRHYRATRKWGDQFSGCRCFYEWFRLSDKSVYGANQPSGRLDERDRHAHQPVAGAHPWRARTHQSARFFSKDRQRDDDGAAPGSQSFRLVAVLTPGDSTFVRADLWYDGQHMSFYDQLKFDANGLIPAIIQEQKTGRVLMMAWMNRASLEKTIETGKTHFWSRSRQKFWMKGEEPAATRRQVKDIAFDCDGDTLLIQVEQTGAACHEGYRSCFFRSVEKAENRSRSRRPNSKRRNKSTERNNGRPGSIWQPRAVFFDARAAGLFARHGFSQHLDATPNLVLEGNPSPKSSAGNGACAERGVVVALALWPLSAIVVTTASVLVAARNFQSAWLMRSLGEEIYREWHVERVRETRVTLYLFCLAGNTLLTAGVGAA
jgi:phosphoribosyl-AMP cyclohydrolase